MELSAGIIFIKDGAVLMGHATETPHWDIPKGHVEKGETHIDAAIRECFEETGFEVFAEEFKERPDMPLERIKAYDRMVELEEENKRLRARMEVLMSAEMMQNNLNMITAMLHSIQNDTNQTKKLLCDRFNVQGYY